MRIAKLKSVYNSLARFIKFAGYLHLEISFSATDISLILKNKMATLGISLNVMYVFLLASSRN